ncbi:hypothetical protein GGS26DRAFT_577460 [Hypomontagnella submonticulosa]|nr:hypothetical protein GGS26DRAFT_577460 [Hypomontagnella submonticulosa]
MCTPNRGSGCADWDLIVRKIFNVAGLDATDRIIRDLNIDAPVLDKIDEGFVPLRKRFAIYTFHEVKGFKGV